MSLLALSREESRRYDRAALAAGISGPVLMEHAGWGATQVLLSLGVSGSVAVVCGKGNNGGDGFVIARRLHQLGVGVEVLLVVPEGGIEGDARTAHIALRRAGVEPTFVDAADPAFTARLRQHEWIVDALLGTGTTGALRPPFDAAIAALNRAGRPILAVDLPSGLDADTGEPASDAVIADHTVTFVAPKIGFANPASRRFTGKLHVVDIGAGPPKPSP